MTDHPAFRRLLCAAPGLEPGQAGRLQQPGRTRAQTAVGFAKYMCREFEPFWMNFEKGFIVVE